jgi:hypothetical protein
MKDKKLEEASREEKQEAPYPEYLTGLNSNCTCCIENGSFNTAH